MSITSVDTELNNLRTIICLRKSEVTVEKISVCNVSEKLMGHGIHGLARFCSRDVTIAAVTSY